MVSLAFGRIRLSSLAPASLVVLFLAAASGLTGCSMDPIPASTTAVTTTASVKLAGTVHGGQQPVAYSTLNLYTAGTGSYGATATAIDTALTTTTNQYYPGGTTGCNATALAVTGFSSTGGGVGGSATFTVASNSMIVGQIVTISGVAAYAGPASVAVTAVTPTTFTVADSTDGVDANGGASGTATPTCYSLPTTDQNGNFTITGDYSCSGNSIAYLVATGGNPGLSPVTTNNSKLALAVPLGTCSALANQPSIIINEVTTAAMAFAMGRYFGSFAAAVDSFGAPSTTQGALGFSNAYKTVANLVNIAAGQANAPFVVGNSTTGKLTVTPDQAKLNTIADILAACVNTDGSTAAGTNCNTLLNDVAPSGATVPTDTLQAAVYMSQNPTSMNGTTSNLSALYTLASSSPPFAGLAGQPSDWTIGIEYGLSTMNSSSLYAVTAPLYLAIDASGDVWIANYTTSNNNLTELSPVGVPLLSTGSEYNLASPYTVTVDPAGNVWVPNGGATASPYTVTEYTTGGTSTNITVGNDPYAIASDGKGNIFVLEGAAGEVDEIPTGSTTYTAVATGLSLSKYSTIAIDSNYNLWITNAGTSLIEIPYNSGTSTYGTAVTTTPSAVTDGEPLLIDGSNNIWVANYVSGGASGTLAKVPAATPTTGSSYTVTGSTNGLEGVAVDGSGNIWATNYSTSTSGVYEVSNSGAELSPTTGFGHTVYHPKGIAVDPSGNVWLGGTDNYVYNSSLLEIVGAATPVVTPIAAGLPTTPGGTNSLGTAP